MINFCGTAPGALRLSPRYLFFQRESSSEAIEVSRLCSQWLRAGALHGHDHRWTVQELAIGLSDEAGHKFG